MKRLWSNKKIQKICYKLVTLVLGFHSNVKIRKCTCQLVLNSTVSKFRHLGHFAQCKLYQFSPLKGFFLAFYPHFILLNSEHFDQLYVLNNMPGLLLFNSPLLLLGVQRNDYGMDPQIRGPYIITGRVSRTEGSASWLVSNRLFKGPLKKRWTELYIVVIELMTC